MHLVSTIQHQHQQLGLHGTAYKADLQRLMDWIPRAKAMTPSSIPFYFLYHFSEHQNLLRLFLLGPQISLEHVFLSVAKRVRATTWNNRTRCPPVFIFPGWPDSWSTKIGPGFDNFVLSRIYHDLGFQRCPFTTTTTCLYHGSVFSYSYEYTFYHESRYQSSDVCLDLVERSQPPLHCVCIVETRSVHICIACRLTFRLRDSGAFVDLWIFVYRVSVCEN